MDDTWIQAITIIFANLAISLTLFLWIRCEANADRRDMANRITSQNADHTQMIFDLTNTVITESKDFHGRLCQIEERNKFHKD